MVGLFCVRVSVQLTLLNVAWGVAVQGVFQVKALVGIVLEDHYLDARLCACLRMKLYPLVEFKDRTDSLGGAGFVVEIFAAATVAKQAQAAHDGLLALFEIDEIEFAKYGISVVAALDCR